jgi:hypothetical protein
MGGLWSATYDCNWELPCSSDQGHIQEFCWGWGVQQIRLRIEGRENGDLAAVALVRGSAQFTNEWNLYSYYVVKDVFSMELGIWLSFVKIFEILGWVWTPQTTPLGMPLAVTGLSVCIQLSGSPYQVTGEVVAWS